MVVHLAFGTDSYSINDICAKCAGAHRTADCAHDDPAQFKYSNCPESEAKGHGAADRQCLHFIALLTKLHARIPETKYKYFPTDDSLTWQLSNQADMNTNDQYATWQYGATQGGGWTQARTHEEGKGTGRLAGGLLGAGEELLRCRVVVVFLASLSSSAHDPF